MSAGNLRRLVFGFASRMAGPKLKNFYRRRNSKLFLRYAFDEQSKQQLRRVFFCDDPARMVSILLALRRIDHEKIPGAIAEVGVYRGDLSHVLRSLAPQRTLYLFDTFIGFDARDTGNASDERFRDTSIDLVKSKIGQLDGVVFRVGYFPDSAQGLEEEKFAFVMLDVDKYAPTLAGLDFFYKRLSPGGYLFAHDFTSSESDWAVSKAVTDFMTDKPEKLIELPDAYGSVVFRKN